MRIVIRRNITDRRRGAAVLTSVPPPCPISVRRTFGLEELESVGHSILSGATSVSPPCLISMSRTFGLEELESVEVGGADLEHQPGGAALVGTRHARVEAEAAAAAPEDHHHVRRVMSRCKFALSGYSQSLVDDRSVIRRYVIACTIILQHPSHLLRV
jgi:hypothetical protein